MYDYQLQVTNEENRHLWALSEIAEPLSVFPLLASNLHSSALRRTWGKWRLQEKRHSVLSSLWRLKCNKAEGPCPVGFCGRTHSWWECEQSLAFAARNTNSKSLSISWVSAAVVSKTRERQSRKHTVSRRRREKKNRAATCDTPTAHCGT